MQREDGGALPWAFGERLHPPAPRLVGQVLRTAQPDARVPPRLAEIGAVDPRRPLAELTGGEHELQVISVSVRALLILVGGKSPATLDTSLDMSSVLGIRILDSLPKRVTPSAAPVGSEGGKRALCELNAIRSRKR